jgi:hypothetical protein
MVFLSIFVQNQVCDEITTPPFYPLLRKGLSDGFHALKFVTRNYLREYNFVTPLYTPEREEKIFFEQLLFCIMNLDVNSWFYTDFNFYSLWVNFVK